jgi:hypothetical protein
MWRVPFYVAPGMTGPELSEGAPDPGLQVVRWPAGIRPVEPRLPYRPSSDEAESSQIGGGSVITPMTRIVPASRSRRAIRDNIPFTIPPASR